MTLAIITCEDEIEEFALLLYGFWGYINEICLNQRKRKKKIRDISCQTGNN